MGTSVHMTADDLLRMPDDGFMYELVHGELKQMPPTGGEHSGMGVRLAARLDAFVESRKLGRVLGADGGFKLGEDTVRAPDASFIRQDRLPAGRLPTGYFAGAPDLAVEIIPPSDILTEVAAKAVEYLSYGARMVWVINPRNRTATVYRSGREPRTIAPDGSLDGEDVVPGFAVTLADLFA